MNEATRREFRAVKRNTIVATGAAIATALGGTAALLGTYRREIKAIRAQLDASSQTALTDAGPIEYGRHGRGRPALVIHGAGGGFDQGLALGRDVLGDNFDIVAPSRFGYLGTAVPEDSSHEAQARAHAALLERLGIDKAIVIGVSAGAPSAIAFALAYPARTQALILLVPRAFSPDAPAVGAPRASRRILAAVERGQDFAFWCVMRLFRSRVVRFLGVPPEVEAAASPEERARVSAIIRRLVPLSRRVAGLATDGGAAIGPWPLERIAAPTLIVSAADDLYGTLPAARFTAKHIPRAQLVELASGGHLMVGRSTEVRAHVARFLEQIAEAAREAA